MSRRELAEAANAYVWKHTGGRQRINMTEHDIGRYERGEVHWPNRWRRYGLRGVLAAKTDAQLGFYPNRKTATADVAERPPPGPGLLPSVDSQYEPGNAAREPWPGNAPPATPGGSGGLGAAVQRHRTRLGLSHGQLAEVLRISPSHVQEIESGNRGVHDLEQLAHLAAALSIPPDELGLSEDLYHLAAARRAGWLPLLRDGSRTGIPSLDTDAVNTSQHRWQEVRRYLNRHRSELGGHAAKLYSKHLRLGPTSLIAHPDWLPQRPVDIDRVKLGWRPGLAPVRVSGNEPEMWPLLPSRAPGRRFERYSSALRYVDPPALFENRPSYRLLDLTWSANAGGMTFGISTYFDKLDTCEALGHEFAAAAAHEPGRSPALQELPLRALIDDPFQLDARAVVPAVTTLTIRVDHGKPAFLLHWRNPAKVATAGGMYDVIPAGEFQPASVAVWDQQNDFDLWRNIVRELSEELLATPEHDGSRSTPIDYDGWPMYRALEDARADGHLKVACLGVGLDALTLAATIMTVLVADGDTFDEIFGEVVPINAEGVTITAGAARNAIPFTRDNVEALLARGRLASPGAACLHLAWTHRRALLGGDDASAATLGLVPTRPPGSPPDRAETARPDANAWLAVRQHLRRNRGELAQAAATLYPDVPRVDGTALLTRPAWLPPDPVPLANLVLDLESARLGAAQPPSLTEIVVHLLPDVEGSRPVRTYAEAVERLERPAVFEDRPTYCLVSTDLTASPASSNFTLGTYFDGFNVGEAAAHEYAAQHRAGHRPTLAQLPLRGLIGDPTDLTRRPATTAITTVTIRSSGEGQDARFLVHWRDPTKVATNPGMYQLAPVGMFQPASRAADRSTVDFDLWRCMVREYSEELLGAKEHDNPDYQQWPFYLELEAARMSGACRPYLLGIGVDPLTFATDILTAVVFTPQAFDTLFANLVTENAEGRLNVTGADGLTGNPFVEAEVARLARLGGMQAAGAATLRLAWRHRRILTGS